jgi:hypothetical protein
MGGQGVEVRVPVGSRMFISLYCQDQLWGSIQLILWVPGDPFPGVQQLGHEADHSPPTSAKVKKTWVYTATPLCFHGIVFNYLNRGTALFFYFTVDIAEVGDPGYETKGQVN